LIFLKINFIFEKWPDGVKRLRREVVLLTDDRNLRVKALSRDVPVRDLPAFLAWSSSAAAASSSSSSMAAVN
jgi:hypothetical protein